MKRFKNILYLINGLDGNKDTLKQALSFVKNNDAKLTVMVISHKLPENFTMYEKKYESFFKEDITKKLEEVRKSLRLKNEVFNKKVKLNVLSKEPALVHIIRSVLKNKYDLVIKEPDKSKKGFKALDMGLMRKCPAPVWLYKPHVELNGFNVAVTISTDFAENNNVRKNMAIEKLTLGASIAKKFKGNLFIISCWDFPFEDFLTSNPHTKVENSKIQDAVNDEYLKSSQTLKNVIKKSGIKSKHKTILERGNADEIIPKFVKTKDIDLLIMGTVARTGISGFVIGNTAENILQNVNCSVLTLKPKGFISPIKIKK